MTDRIIPGVTDPGPVEPPPDDPNDPTSPAYRRLVEETYGIPYEKLIREDRPTLFGTPQAQPVERVAGRRRR